MTIADEARDSAIHCEMVKYAYRQSKDGIVVSFVVHPNDIPAALSISHIGARFMVALVQIGDDEMPVVQPNMGSANKKGPAPTLTQGAATPAANGKRDWRDMKPSAQSAIRCGEAIFWAYLNEEHGYNVGTKDEAAEAVRDKCGIVSRKMLDDERFHAARVIWHQLDSGYVAWNALEHA